MKTFSVRCTFEDRKLGPGVGCTIKVEASSVTVAISKGVREFWQGLNRRERFDAMKSMKIEARRTRQRQEAPPEVYAMLDQALAGGAR